MEEILTVLPFGGTFDLVQIKGSTVKKVFEHSIVRYGSKSGQFLQVSGLSSDTFVHRFAILIRQEVITSDRLILGFLLKAEHLGRDVHVYTVC